MEVKREEEVKCPSCNRFVGVHTTCPYCGARISKRISVMFFKYGALAVAFIGLILLYLAARVVETKIIKVKDIIPSMSFAYVRVQGTISFPPRIYPGTKSLSFTVDDGTGRISIKAYGAVTEELIRTEKLPKIGDWVDVAGQLQVREGRASMIIQRPKEVQVTSAETLIAQVPSLKIAQITRGKIGQLIKCEGKIIDIRTFTKGRSLKISDGSGDIDVVIWDTDYEKISNKGALQIGREVSVQGVIGEYRGKLQVKPRAPEEIKIVGAKEEVTVAPSVTTPPVAVEVSALSIGQITKDRIGQTVNCQGTITQYKPFSKGAMLVVSDETGRIVVVLWDKVKNQITDNRIFIVGNRISVQGKVGIYREQLQLVPRIAADIKVMEGEAG
ncbi:hypothetical protein KAT51_04760 [bacterium]|nr:hypothetical protein [bacterium]